MTKPENSEWLTRKILVDKALRAAGWRVTPHRDRLALSRLDRCAIEEYPTANGPADYTLVLDGRVLGVVEAKKLSLGPQNVLVQAERYSRGVESDGSWGEYGVPFLYSTNGEVIWYHDVRHEHNRSRVVAGFHMPEALREYLRRDDDAALSRLAALPNDGSRLRPYQRDANTAIEEALAGRKRHMLVAMATGTGKTFTIVNKIYRLMKACVARRILFLVDRRALAAQAVRSFASFDAEPGLKFDRVFEVYSQRFQREDIEEKFDPKVLPKSYLTEPKPGSAFVYVSTIQRMTINLFGGQAVFGLGDEMIDDDDEQLDIPIHAFDLIVADECHRGYTSSEVAIWRRVLDHFDAVKVGLTATPAAHTSSYFKDVVYRYPYERAVLEGFLVDYDVVTIKSNVRLNGVFLNEGEEVGVVNPESGAKTMDVLEDERSFDTTTIEREITAPDSNKKILEELKTYSLAHEERYGRFPKTLIFAANDLPHTSHADQLVDQARDLFGRGDSFVAKITGSPTVDRPLQRIREFRNRPAPSIVVTVDMLSTGVDIPDLECIVFPMIGRLAEAILHFVPSVRSALQQTYAYVLLDEFQDTTHVQYDLTHTAFHGSPSILTAVGDHKQRIMGWAMALDDAFACFEQDFGAKPESLLMNYRSAPELVRIQEFMIKALDPTGAQPQAAEHLKDAEGSAKILVFPEHQTEARYLADLIRSFVDQEGLTPRDVCVLCKQKPDVYAETLLEELRAQGIKGRIENELQDLLAEPLTELAIAHLRLATQSRAPEEWEFAMEFACGAQGVDPHDPASRSVENALTRVIGTLRVGLGWYPTAEEHVHAVLELALTAADRAGLKQAHLQYRHGTLFNDTLVSLRGQLWASVQRSTTWAAALDDFSGVDTVPVMTIHKSKGLEYHTVIFLGLEDSAFWSFAAQPVEDTCAFFVAFSRAKRRVLFTFCKQRTTSPRHQDYPQAAKGIRPLYDILSAAGVKTRRVEQASQS